MAQPCLAAQMSRRRRVWLVLLVVVGALFFITFLTTDGLASFGGTATGERLARMTQSPRWKDGRFLNLEPTEMMKEGTGAAALEWFTNREHRSPTCQLPLVRDASALATPPASELRLTWLGHSTTLLEVDGVRVLTDPQFSERASPSTIAGPRRFHPPPLALEALPPIDAVVVSHDHYDHLDMNSVKALAKKGVHFHVGLGVGAHLEAWGVPAEQVHELDWWEERALPNGVRLVATPARHFSGRTLTDRDHTSWTSWTVVGPRHRVFFSGDTGLTDQFTQVREKLGPLDVALLEIGQYHPSWGSIHLGPKGALEAHRMLGAATLLPIHWGTFELGLHDWNEPPETLLKEAGPLGVITITPRLGEPIEPLTGARGTPWWRSFPPLAGACPAEG